MVTKIIFVLCVVLGAALLAFLVDLVRKKEMGIESERMSFRETLDLTDLPIVTFKQGDSKLNFLLDTGATGSMINSSLLDSIKHGKTDLRTNVYGIDGKSVETSIVEMDIEYKGKTYKENFIVSDLDASFGNLKKTCGVNLHGIIGNSFFQKYRYVIDFDELVAYSMD